MKKIFLSIILLQSMMIVFGSSKLCAELEVLDCNGAYVGVMQGYDNDAIRVYNENVDAFFEVSGDGTFTYLGPHLDTDVTFYFSGANCTGERYVVARNPFRKVFIESCSNSPTPVGPVQFDLFKTEKVSTFVQLKSQIPYRQGNGCGYCAPTTLTSNDVPLYRVVEIPFSDISQDFEYPVPIPVELVPKAVEISGSIPTKITNLEVDNLAVNNQITSNGTDQFNSITVKNLNIGN